MTTSPVSLTPPNVRQSRTKELKTEDFIKMMITQLQNQDPLEPAKNQELLAQMSQISQLQSATTLQETVKEMAQQNQETIGTLALSGQIASAGNLIGKLIEGAGPDGKSVSGLVTSVKVQNNQVQLELDNGKTLPLSNVTRIAPSQGTAIAA